MEELGQGQLPMVMPRYPHMLSEDHDVWSQFLSNGWPNLQRVWYDVRCGSIPEQFRDVGGLPERIARGLYRKRIDVVCLTGVTLWVVEVKPFGSMFALGQVLTYQRLFQHDYGKNLSTIPVVVCYRGDPDIEEMASDLGVLVVEVGPYED